MALVAHDWPEDGAAKGGSVGVLGSLQNCAKDLRLENPQFWNPICVEQMRAQRRAGCTYILKIGENYVVIAEESLAPVFGQGIASRKITNLAHVKRKVSVDIEIVEIVI